MNTATVVDQDVTPVGEEGWCHVVCSGCVRQLCTGEATEPGSHEDEAYGAVCVCGLPNCLPCAELDDPDGPCPWCGYGG